MKYFASSLGPLNLSFLPANDQVSPSLFLEFFRSLSKVEVLKIFIVVDEDSHVIWPAGYFTNASAIFSNHSPRLRAPLSVRAHYQRDRLPRWVIDDDNESLIERSIESFEASFTNLNEEIMGWFRMKESLKHVEILSVDKVLMAIYLIVYLLN